MNNLPKSPARGDDLNAQQSASLLRLRLRKFRRLKRGYYSLVLLLTTYLLSFLLPFIMGFRPILVRYEGKFFFPACATYLDETFGISKIFGISTARVYLGSEFNQTEADGRRVFGEADYRALARQFEEADSNNFAIMPPIPFGPNEGFLDLEGNPPHPPSRTHWMGTDNAGRDVFVRLAYGYRTSISFSMLVTLVAYTIGTLTGAVLGYFGSWIDILGLRLVEIWSAVPFLYTVIIVASIYGPNFKILALILAAFGWMGITYYIRGEFYREKSKDYVAAAIATGEGSLRIIVAHILPNSLTPIIAFAPFAIVGMIVALVSLDFLGYGLPAPTASWGELLRQAREAGMRVPHLVIFPLGAMFVTLQLIVFIGEAVREAFDPKVFSRLR